MHPSTESRKKQHYHNDHQKRDRHGTLDEHVPMSSAHRKRIAHLGFGKWPQDHADDDWRGRDVKSTHYYTQHADCIKQHQVKRTLTHSVYTYRCKNQNSGIKIGLGNLEEFDPQTDQRQVQN